MYNGYVIRGDRNGLGTAGLVLGTLALATSVIPLIGIVAWLMWPVALVLSLAGLARCDRQLATNRSSAVAGVIVSGVSGAVCLGWVVFTLLGTPGT